MSPDELRAKAKELFDKANKISDADERLPVVLRAIELEADAAALERDAPPDPHVIDQQKRGDERA